MAKAIQRSPAFRTTGPWWVKWTRKVLCTRAPWGVRQGMAICRVTIGLSSAP